MPNPRDSQIDFGEPYFAELSNQRRKTGLWSSILGLGISLLLLTAVLLPAPYVIERPGTAYNVLGNVDGTPTLTVSGATTYPTDGALELMTIEIYGSPEQTPTWMELFFAWLDPSQVIVPVEVDFPQGTTTQQLNDDAQIMFVGSEVDSEAAALNALGYQLDPVLQVQAIKNGMPADKVMMVGDEPQTVDGKKIETVEQFVAAVENSGGKELAVEVLRDGKLTALKLTPVKKDGDYRIGIVVGPGYDFPVETKVNIADVGGPSGGLILALGIYDKLTEGSLTGGNIIAGTGTITPDGVVGPIGGVVSKLYLAKSTGAKYFLTPAENCAEAAAHVPSGLTLLKVQSLSEGIRAVEAIADSTADQLPTCQAAEK